MCVVQRLAIMCDLLINKAIPNNNNMYIVCTSQKLYKQMLYNKGV